MPNSAGNDECVDQKDSSDCHSDDLDKKSRSVTKLRYIQCVFCSFWGQNYKRIAAQVILGLSG